MRRSLRLALLLVPVVLTGGSPAQGARQALVRRPAADGGASLVGAGSSSSELRAEEPEAVPARLGAMRRDPGRALGRHVSFVIQFRSWTDEWNPFGTRFGAASWSCLSVWGDEQLLWEDDPWRDPAPRLFARRGSVVQALLEHARRYERFEVEGVVRQVFLGEPWIELVAVRRLPEAVSEGTLIHAGRALDLIEAEAYENALAELDRAAVGPLPEHVRHALDLLREECEESSPPLED